MRAHAMGGRAVKRNVLFCAAVAAILALPLPAKDPCDLEGAPLERELAKIGPLPIKEIPALAE